MSATPAEIARRALADHLASLPPSELLARYARRNDPEAFAGLVQQFGPMVLGVCRRVLGPTSDADDAFQAVFLTLVRSLPSLPDFSNIRLTGRAVLGNDMSRCLRSSLSPLVAVSARRDSGEGA